MSTTAEEARTCEMRIMGAKGDTRVTWNARDTDEVAQAKKTFDDLRGKRFLAFNVTADGSKGEQVTEFSPDAQKMIMVPPMAGGAGVVEERVEIIDDRPHRDASDEEVEAGTLEWVNTIRTEYGAEALTELPAGVRGEGSACAIARALTAITDDSARFKHYAGRTPSEHTAGRRPGSCTARFSREGKVHNISAPAIVGEYVARFDAGKIGRSFGPSRPGVIL